MPNARVTGEFFTHQQLWRTAEFFLAQGQEDEEGSFYPFLAASLFGWLAFEATMNELLRQLHPQEFADERTFFRNEPYRGVLGKYRFLCERLDLRALMDTPASATVVALRDARDFLVHARTEVFDAVVPLEAVDSVRRQQSQLDSMGTNEFASSSLAAVREVADALVITAYRRHGYLGFGSESGAFRGIDGSWSASVQSEPHARDT